MLRNSLSVDMKVYALQLKQKSILGNFRKTTFEIFFFFFFLKRGGGGAASEKKTGEEKDVQWPWWFQVSFFPGQLFSKSWNISSSFYSNICITESFNLDYLIHFYKPKKQLSNLPRLNECAAVPSVNNVTKST